MNDDWTEGYRTDIAYTYGYYRELNPLRMKLAFINAGVVFPAIETACDLGFGNGISLNIHAAASTTKWYGTDFNPSQAGLARELAAFSGAGAQIYDDSFIEFASRSDLPDFDFIGLHGIWSWISGDNRAVIVDFVRRKLKIGGVLYLSYNTYPGWSAFSPVRQLMNAHANTLGAKGDGIASRVEASLRFVERLLATNPAYTRAYPQVLENWEKMVKARNRSYVAHEFFNRHWAPTYFADMVEELKPAKLSYACSAHYLDSIVGINLTQEQQAFLQTIRDPELRESLLDFMTNEQFRRDYWVKGARRLDSVEQASSLRDVRIILLQPRSAAPTKVTGKQSGRRVKQ